MRMIDDLEMAVLRFDGRLRETRALPCYWSRWHLRELQNVIAVTFTFGRAISYKPYGHH